MKSRAQSVFRWMLYSLAAMVIAMALVVGTARLLLPLVPDYQDDIRAWASEATGYDIRFNGISASWPLSGPQLTFIDVTLTRPGEPEVMLSAREFSAGLSLWRLVRHAQASVGIISVRGSRLRVEHTEEGELRIQDRPLQDLLPARHRDDTPEIRLDLSEIEVSYLDVARDPRPVLLDFERLQLSLEPGDVSARATIGLPERFGGKLVFEAEVPGSLPEPLTLPPSWNGQLRGQGVNLEKLLAYVLVAPDALLAASGDVLVQLQVRGGGVQRLKSVLSLDNVVVGTADVVTTYEQLSGGFEWARSGSGWQARLENLRLRREGRNAPPAAATLRRIAADEARSGQWELNAEFLRLDDLLPLVRAGLAGTELESRLPAALSGDLRDLQAALSGDAETPGTYSVRADFHRLGLTTANGEAAVSGLSGTLAADGDGGRLQLSSRDVGVLLSQWFREELRAQSMDGLLVWRSGPEGTRFLSDNVRVQAEDIRIGSRLELVFPPGGDSPVLDIKARASATQAREVLRYLPLRRFPPQVVDWLERSVLAGRVPRADIKFSGPVRDFPFDHGEGVFRAALALEDATLDYANGWPRVESLNAEVVFDGVGMYSTTNAASLAGLRVNDYTIRIPDLRKGMLAVSGRQRVGLEQLLDFVRATPLSAQISQTLERVTGSGPVDANLRLALPIRNLGDYDLRLLLDARSCRLGWKRLPLALSDLRGRVQLHNTRFSAAGLQGIMLGEPVELAIQPGDAAVGTPMHVARLRGATPVARVASTFSLPLRRYLEGNLDWAATVTIPSPRSGAPEPLTVALHSDLAGVTSSLPAPLAKSAAASWPLELNLAFPAGDIIELTGGMVPTVAWALRLASRDGGWQVERGMVRAGPGEVSLPAGPGVELVGSVEELRLADWLDVGKGGEGRPFQDIYRGADLKVGSLTVAGQVFRDVTASARPGSDAWAVGIEAPNAEGTVSIPFDTSARPLVLDMKRLWLLEAAPDSGDGKTDPRNIPAMQIRSADTALGAWRFGKLDMNLEKEVDGLVARRIATRAGIFKIDGKAAWRVRGGDVQHQSTRLEATLTSTAVQATLERLGYGPVLSGDQARVYTTLEWPDGPRAGFMNQATGRISVEIKDGQILDLEPGSGRLLGLMSVTALPRRLALDFSDVYSKGLAFDSVKGDFRIGSGSAYTCNLGLTGPAVDIAIVGRTDLARDTYDQLAVVRPQMSSMLAVGGAVLGGPVGGVTMLLISQLFRKPLSSLGETYYEVSGAWDQPAVTRVERGKLDLSAFKDCEKEVAAALPDEPPASPATPAAPAAPAPR